MSNRKMLEASMLLHRDSANYLLGAVRHEGMKIEVSRTFLDIGEAEPDLLIRRLSPALGIAQQDIVSENTFKELISFFKLQGYRIPDDPNHIYDGGGRLAEQAIFDEFYNDSLVSKILFEEYYFLTHESWIYSKTRNAFDGMVEGGGTAIQFSKRKFDSIVSKTLKLENDLEIKPSDRFRAAAKWIAVGGPSILGVVGVLGILPPNVTLYS